MHISATRYREEGAPRFTMVTRDEKMIEDDVEAETVSNSEEENKKRALCKEKRDAWALSLAATRPSAFVSAVSVPRSAFLSVSAFASASAVSVPGSSALPSASGVFVPVLGLSALLLFTFLSTCGVSVPVPGLLALLSVLFVFGLFVPVPGLSAPSFMFGVPVPELGSSPLPFPIWSDSQTLTPVPGRRRLSQWSGILERAFLEEAPTTCAPLFPLSERPSPLFFPSGDISKKRPFDKAFNIDCWPLADDYAGEDVGQRKFDKTFINAWLLADNHAKKEVDLSFAGCGCSSRVKLNRPWQIELLEQRPACIVETIPLVAAIFWNPNFVPCPCHTLNLSKKWASRQKTFLVP